jgi:hypothetical protein
LIRFFAVDEGTGRLALASSDGADWSVETYAYPRLRRLRSRPFGRKDVHRVELLPGAVVVQDRDGLVSLLDPQSLATLEQIPGVRALAVDVSTSTLALLSDAGELGIVKVAIGGGITKAPAVPWPGPPRVRELAVLPSGAVLYTVALQKGLYHIPPPYKTPALVLAGGEGVWSIRPDPSGAIFLTDGGALLVWDAGTLAPVAGVWVFRRAGEGERAPPQVEDAHRRGALADAHPGASAFGSRGSLYCPKRRLFVVQHIRGKEDTDIFFISADSFSVVDRISPGYAFGVDLHLSADGKTLLIFTGSTIQVWDVAAFL